MALYRTLLLALLWAFNGSSPFANAQTSQGLRVEFDAQGIITGCCSQAFYNATSLELIKYVNLTTTITLLGLGVSLNNLVISPFVLVNSNMCLYRERSLLRGKESDNAVSVQRETKTYSSTCSSCTSKSCSSYCSGCYLCSSSRRHLDRDLQLGGILGGVIGGVLGVSTSVLDLAVAAVAAGIQPYFAAWLTTGPAAALANGCMGTPSALQVLVSLN